MAATSTMISRSSSAVSVQPLHSHLTSDSPSTSLQRTYSRNVMNLEQRAEEMSQGGSDVGEEIRKMNEEQKQRSRQNSIQSSHQGDAETSRGAVGGALKRVKSGRSRASSNSIVNVNGAARWGGYSPTGFISSPVGSVRSASGWSHVSAPRKASAGGSSKLAQMVEPVHEGRPLDSPLLVSQSMYSDSTPQQTILSRHHSQSSAARHYDPVASQISQQYGAQLPVLVASGEPLVDFNAMDGYRNTATPPPRPRSTDTYREAQIAFQDFDGVHFSPETEELIELDENGNEIRRVSARMSSGGLSLDAASMLRAPRQRPMSFAEPPPADGMVYYPAPVPRMLNLPKRLSQLPSANTQAQRRSQVLGSIPLEARESAPWLYQPGLNARHTRQTSGSQSGGSAPARSMLNERMSVANLQNLPPQLRASVYFDQLSVPHNVEIQSESAVATLDNILAASAHAPVNAFTDHPFAGDIRKSTYAPEKQPRLNRSTTTPVVVAATDDLEAAKKQKRRSSIGNLMRRNSSADRLSQTLEKRESRASLLLDLTNEGGNKLRKRRSQMSLGDEITRHGEAVRTPGNEISEPDLSGGLIAQAQNPATDEELEASQRIPSGSRPGTAMQPREVDEAEQIEQDFRDEAQQEDVEDEGEPVFVQPSTLLAELQVRKARQKNRNRTAATHFPNGMHSTLLELDAVEEINKAKRMKKRVPLAWEDPSSRAMEQDEEDDDVPLGVLFPGKDGLINGKKKLGDGRDWDRPLGLMERRELEDSEPLSSRRNRMLGLPADFGRAEKALKQAGILPNTSQLHLAGQPDAPPEGETEDEPEGGETLAQRLRRLKTKNELDGALEGSVPLDSRPLSTFSDDLLNQFDKLDTDPGNKDNPSSPNPGTEAAAGAATTAPDEEETLQQRRARLQREGVTAAPTGTNPLAATTGQGPTRPTMLRSSSSLANLLSTNPVRTAADRPSRHLHEPAAGTLLHDSAQQQAKQREQLLNMNRRASSYGLDNPMVAVDPQTQQGLGGASRGGLLAQQASGRAPTGGFAGGVYNTGFGGAGIGMPTSVATPVMNGGGGYFVSPTAALMNGGGAGVMQVPVPRFHGQYPGPVALPYQPPAMSPIGMGMGMPGYGFGGQMPWMMNMGMGVGMPMGMGMMDDPSMDAKKREGIDRWRMSVAPQ